MAGKAQTKGFILSANDQQAAENGIRHIMARLKNGYPKKDGYMNRAYMDADHKMLTVYLNRSTKD